MNKFCLLLIVSYLLLVACNFSKAEEKELVISPEDIAAERVERGKYLVNAIGCADCHSPKIMTEKGPEPDPDLNLSGHPSSESLLPLHSEAPEGYILFNMHGTASTGPWGTSFAANLTPHETGLGNWSEEQFLRAIREGKYKGLEGSRELLPLMPWMFYRNFNDEDLKSIFAYLQTLEPVDNVVPNPIPPAGS